MGLLEHIKNPDDLRRQPVDRLPDLAGEIRRFLVESVCRRGGHLGPNLGVVELTLALHRVFDSPRVPIVFDTGHQAYVHKLLTGRMDGFDRLRAQGGLSGYPNRAESGHDLVENSHASTALAYADGLSRGAALSGSGHLPVVAVVGDGALTGGLAWEALNNLGGSGRRVVVVLNDNGRSYSPTVGALSAHLARVADRPRYAALQQLLGGDRVGTDPGQPATETAGGIFESLGFGYLGPVDGHDLTALESAFTKARELPGPVVVHCLTRKGHGYRPAEEDQDDRFHTVGVLEPETGRPLQAPGRTWTDAFADALVDLGTRRPDVVALSAAMLGPTGLRRFADRYPTRCFDTGIAEQHAVTCAAGLATAGLHPVVALYATFANRAFDQTLLDVGLHGLPVTLVLDRAGVTGPDGPSHHGMWDLALLAMVPGMRVAAPRDAATLAEELEQAVAVDGPTALRFPKAAVGAPVPAVRRGAAGDLLREDPRHDVLLVSIGAVASAVVEAARQLADRGIGCSVLDPRWALPVGDAMVELAAQHRQVVVVEDGLRVGGVGSRVAARLDAGGVDVPVSCLGLPTAYLPHGTRAEILSHYGLDPAGLVDAVATLWWRTARAPARLALVRPSSGGRA
jgi:1-deoxy-D-xylulose-5-phosphate synthase